MHPAMPKQDKERQRLLWLFRHRRSAPMNLRDARSQIKLDYGKIHLKNIIISKKQSINHKKFYNKCCYL